jgi:hypothetical protein
MDFRPVWKCESSGGDSVKYSIRLIFVPADIASFQALRCQEEVALRRIRRSPGYDPSVCSTTGDRRYAAIQPGRSMRGMTAARSRGALRWRDAPVWRTLSAFGTGIDAKLRGCHLDMLAAHSTNDRLISKPAAAVFGHRRCLGREAPSAPGPRHTPVFINRNQLLLRPGERPTNVVYKVSLAGAEAQGIGQIELCQRRSSRRMTRADAPLQYRPFPLPRSRSPAAPPAAWMCLPRARQPRSSLLLG